MKFEELHSYIKEQYKKYDAKKKKYDVQIKEYNIEQKKINDNYAKEINSIEKQILEETRIAQEEAKKLFDEELITSYCDEFEIETADEETVYKYYFFSNFLDEITKYPEKGDGPFDPNIEGKLKNIFRVDLNPSFFIKNIDFFAQLKKECDKTLLDYKIMKQIETMLSNKKFYLENQVNKVKEYQRKIINNKKAIKELETELKKWWVFGKKKKKLEAGINNLNKDIKINESLIKNIEPDIQNLEQVKASLNECKVFIEQYNSGNPHNMEFENEELNRLYSLMHNSIETFITNSVSIQQNRENITEKLNQQKKELQELEIKRPKQPNKPTPQKIYNDEWAMDEELIAEIKKLDESALDENVIEICDKIIKENKKVHKKESKEKN